jgi:hypothetical protein
VVAIDWLEGRIVTPSDMNNRRQAGLIHRLSTIK